MEEINFTIRRGLFDNRKRQLILSPEFIQFDDKDLIAQQFTRFEKNEIRELRYGINWIRGDMFTIGREYQVFIRSKSNKIIKIYFKSFYGFRRNELHKLYGEIVSAVWDLYFGPIADDLLARFSNGEDIDVGEVQISKDGVGIKTSGIFKEKKKIIPWESVRTTNYYTYYNIHSAEDVANINRGYSYLTDWNTGILYSVLQTILEEKIFIKQELK